jgi:hypothetical protein
MDRIHDHLVERYVYAVTRRLPTAQREDVSMELHSLIDEMVQDRAEDPQSVATVLMEMGDPAELADRYRGMQRHLIGSGYFDFYILVLKIVGFAVSLGIVISFAIGVVFNSPESVGSIIGNLIGTLFSAYAQAFAWVTVVFAIMEWNQRRLGKSERFEQWSLEDLPDIPQKSTLIPRSEPIVSLVFLVVFFAILNASSWILKVSQIENHIYFINPFIPEVFQRVLILFNLTIAIAMGIEFAKLYSGVQTKRLALLTIGLKLFSLCISLYIVAGSGIWNPDFPIHMVQVFGEDIGVSPIFQKFWNNFPTFLVVVMIFGYVIETIQTVWRTWNVRFPEK